MIGEQEDIVRYLRERAIKIYGADPFIRRRERNRAWARFAMTVVMVEYGYKLTLIYKLLNYRTHSTLVHSKKQHENLYKHDELYTEYYDKFIGGIDISKLGSHAYTTLIRKINKFSVFEIEIINNFINENFK